MEQAVPLAAMKAASMEHGAWSMEQAVPLATRNAGFKGLMAWQKAMELASAVYRVTKKLPVEDRWLRSQANRAAFSVSANIAEGYGRRSLGDYARFLDIATGSLNELENCLHFMTMEDLISGGDAATLEPLRGTTGRLLHGLSESLKKQSRQGWKDGQAVVRDGRE